jgi:hypothetical protein
LSTIDSKLRRARRKLAGGGAVRNFFTGINGSVLDSVLNTLKGKATAPYPMSVIEKSKEAGATADEIAAAQRAQWVDRNLRNYLVRQHGTPNDPLKPLFPDTEIAVGSRGAADYWADLVGSSPVGRYGKELIRAALPVGRNLPGAGLERRQFRIKLVPGRSATRPDVHLRAEQRRVVQARGLKKHELGARTELAGDRTAACGTKAALGARTSFRSDGVVTQLTAQPHVLCRDDEDRGVG